MKVLCINDKNRPAELPTSKWIKKDEIYTVIDVIKCTSQGGIFGYVLEEIDLKGYEPYMCFSAHRFALPIEDKVIKEEILEEIMI